MSAARHSPPPGYTITPGTRRSVAGFRRTLPPRETALHVCPPDCREDHDAYKTPGRDHWKPWPAPRRRKKK